LQVIVGSVDIVDVIEDYKKADGLPCFNAHLTLPHIDSPSYQYNIKSLVALP